MFHFLTVTTPFTCWLSFQCSVAMRSESFGSTRMQTLLFTQRQWSKVNPEINLTMKDREDASALPLLPYVHVSEISQRSYNVQNKTVVRAPTNCVNISHSNDTGRKVAGSIPDGAICILLRDVLDSASSRNEYQRCLLGVKPAGV